MKFVSAVHALLPAVLPAVLPAALPGMLLAGALAPAAAQAQTASAPAAKGPAVGLTVFGPQGGEVGKIESITGDVAVVDTGKNKAALPLSAFAAGPNGPVIGFNRKQLDNAVEAAAQKAAAALDAALVVGAEVRGQNGAVIGTVKDVSADGNVTIARESGDILMPKANFTADAKGPVLRMTAQQLEAAIKQSTAAPAAPAAAS